jgi:signal transduction histidine kinase
MTLETIPLFRLLGRDELQALRFIAQERQFAPGQLIFPEGAAGDGVYFVRSGLVEISAGGADRRVISRLGPGEIFGEMAIIEHRPRSAAAAAAEPTEVYFLPRGEMLTFIERCPSVALGLLQQISHRLREFNHVHVQELVKAESLAVIGRFAQSIVHDLKNPLSIISLSSEMSELPGATPELRAKAQMRIRKQVDRINDMVSDILIFTQGNRRSVDLKMGDYGAFAAELVGDLRAEVEPRAVLIEMDKLPPAVLIRFDSRRLSRVFYNLAHNACDAMTEGGIIYVRFELRGGELVTEIEDTGSGVAPEVADRLFQPFTTHGKQHGTGLGLSICKKIVEDHGGHISLRSEPGHGAIFAFTLPLPK